MIVELVLLHCADQVLAGQHQWHGSEILQVLLRELVSFQFIETLLQARLRHDFSELLPQLPVNILHQVANQEALAEELWDAEALQILKVSGE